MTNPNLPPAGEAPAEFHLPPEDVVFNSMDHIIMRPKVQVDPEHGLPEYSEF